MKDQYFGDVNDFRKYALLRALVNPDRLRLGVSWMLTESDDKTDGKFLSYLGKPGVFRGHDAELFDWLKRTVEAERDRRTSRIETSGLFAFATFQSRILADGRDDRDKYFAECLDQFNGCDLVFFDPDNGLEIKSKLRGRKDSRKYLYWQEVCGAFAEGASVLIYQHFPREERENYIDRLSCELRERACAATIFSFQTPHVLFLLASQERHLNIFRARLTAIQTLWDTRQIRVREHLSSPEASC